MSQDYKTLENMVAHNNIIPVIVMNDLDKAVPLAKTFQKTGFKTIEMTLRTPKSLEAIHRIVNEVEDIFVGAGTVLNTKDFEEAVKFGAKFIVSPGFHKDLTIIARERKIPLLPGAVTPSEIMSAIACHYHYLKFFPATQMGGLDYLKAIGGPFPNIKFCPTGGIQQNNIQNWLSLKNVFCAGTSWIAPQNLIDEGDFLEIEKRCLQMKAFLSSKKI